MNVAQNEKRNGGGVIEKNIQIHSTDHRSPDLDLAERQQNTIGRRTT